MYYFERNIANHFLYILKHYLFVMVDLEINRKSFRALWVCLN
jgi:hypothetical protein